MIRLNLNKKLTKAQNGTVIPVARHQNYFTADPFGEGLDRPNNNLYDERSRGGSNAYSAPTSGGQGFSGEATRNRTNADATVQSQIAQETQARIDEEKERQQEIDRNTLAPYSYYRKYDLDKKPISGYSPGTPGHTFALYGEDIKNYQYGFDSAEDNIALANQLRGIYTDYTGSERQEKLDALRESQYQRYLNNPERLAAISRDMEYNEGIQSNIDMDFGPGVDNARADVNNFRYQMRWDPLLYQDKKLPHKNINYNSLNSQIHTALGTFGMVPVVGEPFNLLDAGLYHLEGDNFNRNLSLGSTVPFFGNATGAFQLGKNAAKSISNFSKNQRAFNRIRQNARNRAMINNIVKEGGGDLKYFNKAERYTNVHDIKRGTDPMHNLVHDVYDEAVQNQLKYLDSPVLRERLKNQGFSKKTIDAFIAEKKAILSGNLNIKNIENVPDSGKSTLGAMAPNNSELGINLNLIVNKAEGNPAEIKKSLERVINHELNHMGTYYNDVMSVQDDVLKASVTKSRPSSMAQEDWDYLSDPDEIYARVRTIQDDVAKLSDDAAQSGSSSALDTQPIGGEDFIDYGRNSSTQNLIDYNSPGGVLNKETFDQIKDKLPAGTIDDLDDLRDVMDDDEILNLINSIVENDAPIQEEMFYAEQGGKIPVKKHQSFFSELGEAVSRKPSNKTTPQPTPSLGLNYDLLNFEEPDFNDPMVMQVDNTGRPGEVQRLNNAMAFAQNQMKQNQTLATDDGQWERADDAKARRREEQGEGNANTIINYYAAYYSGNPADDDKTHAVKPGENLTRIAKNYGLDATAVISANPQIKNPSRINVGQPITIPGTNPKVFAVADKNTGRMHIYNIADVKAGNLNPYMSMPMLVGGRSGTDPLADAQTVTKYYPGGRRVDWSLGNDATGAGTYYVSRANKKSKYRPSSLERRATGASGSSPSFNLKNESGIEVATTIHGTPNVDVSLIDNGPLVYDLTRVEALLEGPAFQAARDQYNATKGPDDPPFESIAFRGSNGCINGLCDDLNTLYDDPDFTVGTPIHILPDNSENFYEIVDGNLVFRASKAQRELANEEYQPDDYLEDIDPNYKATRPLQKGQGINVSRSTISYEPARIVFDKGALGASGMIDNWSGNTATRTNQWEYQNRAVPFMTAISDNKKRILDALVKNGSGITSEEYNSVIPITVGIFGVESGFGNETSNLEDAVKAGRKEYYGSEESVSNADVTGEYEYLNAAGKDLKDHSVGWTQINWNTALTKKEKEILADLGIYGPQDFIDPEKSAIATQAILGHRLNARPGNNTFEKLTKSFNNAPNYPDRVAAFSQFVDVYVPVNNSYYTQMNETGTTTYSPSFATLGDYYDPYTYDNVNLNLDIPGYGEISSPTILPTSETIGRFMDSPIMFTGYNVVRGGVNVGNALGSGLIDLIGGPERLVNTYERATNLYHNAKSKIENLFEEGGKVPVRKHQEFDEFGNVYLDPNKSISKQTKTLTEEQQERANLATAGAKQYVDPTYFNNYTEAADTYTPKNYTYAPGRDNLLETLKNTRIIGSEGDIYEVDFINASNERFPGAKDAFYDSEVFMQQWMDSPQYEKLLLESTVGKPGDMKYGREENLASAKGNQFITGDIGDMSAGTVGAFSYHSFPATLYNYHSFDNTPWLKSVAVHELSHATDRPYGEYERLIPESDIEFATNLLLPRDEVSDNFKDYGLSTGSKSGLSEEAYQYYANPTELRARGNEARAALAGDGVDIFTQDVTIDDIDDAIDAFESGKWGGDKSKYRALIKLVSLYGKEGAVSFLNTVSQAEPQEGQEEMFYGKQGGKIKLDINKRLGIDVAKLPPIPIGSRGLKKYAKKNPLAVAALGKNPFRVAGSPPKDLLG